jgi:hypothetical protein
MQGEDPDRSPVTRFGCAREDKPGRDRRRSRRPLEIPVPGITVGFPNSDFYLQVYSGGFADAGLRTTFLTGQRTENLRSTL